jgi:cell wall-associated NlpC family hydrolase
MDAAPVPAAATNSLPPAPASGAATDPAPSSGGQPSPGGSSFRAPALQLRASSGGLARAVVQTAHGYVGVPYRRGGIDQRGIDCSGLVCAVFSAVRIELPRTCVEQAEMGRRVPLREIRPGDLLFFGHKDGRVTHVGIYAGEGAFIHASGSEGRVRVDDLGSSYFAARLTGARRVLP